MTGKRKYHAWWASLVAATLLTAGAMALALVKEGESPTTALALYLDMMPWLFAGFGAANVGEHISNRGKKDA